MCVYVGDLPVLIAARASNSIRLLLVEAFVSGIEEGLAEGSSGLP